LTFDTNLPNPVSLRQITGKELDPKTLAQRIANALNEQIHAWRRDGFHPLLKQYRNQLFGKDASFTVRENGKEKVIRILDVGDEGALLIEEEGVQRSIVSGLEWIIRA
jgi:BirA family biotin operon repressor/biotin-[acetyl-CoA-carboxylase] ligase